MKKLFVIAASAVTVVGSGLGLGTLAVASAQTPTNSTIEQNKTDKRQDRRVRIDARLNQAVRDGTITSAQETAFKAEVKTLRVSEKASLKAATTKAERQAAHQTFKTSLEAWATSSNFPLSKIFPKL